MISTDGLSVVVAVFEAGCTAVAAGCAIWVALRDGRWRKNGLAAQLSDRIETAQRTAERWFETEPAKMMRADIDAHERTLLGHEGKLENVATKEDVERVTGMISRVESTVEDAAAGVDRIEGILIRRALNPERA